MAVPNIRSTKIAPESLSTSYLMGSLFMGISMITLTSSGRLLPAGTSFKLIVRPLRAVFDGAHDSTSQPYDTYFDPIVIFKKNNSKVHLINQLALSYMKQRRMTCFQDYY